MDLFDRLKLDVLKADAVCLEQAVPGLFLKNRPIRLFVQGLPTGGLHARDEICQWRIHSDPSDTIPGEDKLPFDFRIFPWRRGKDVGLWRFFRNRYHS